MRHLFALACVAALAGCTLSPTNKPVVTAATVGTDLIALGSTVHLASTYVTAQPTPNVAAAAKLDQASTALTAMGNDLRTSGTSTGDAHANILLAETGLQAAADGYASTSPAAASRVAEFRAALSVALALYNSDAAANGLPQVAVAGL